jgi:ubiquinone/menaquinone biosynthesis C-methylase UbiE
MNNISEWDKEYCRNSQTEKYQEIDNYWWEDCYDEIELFLTKNLDINHNTKILEAGSGSGNSSLRLAKKAKEIHLLDSSPNALKCARNLADYYKSSNVVFKIGDIFSLPYPNKSFDLCWNIGVIEHYNAKECEKIIREMARVVKNNGYLCIGIPNFSSLPIIKAKVLASKFLKLLTSQIKGYRLKDENRYDESSLMEMIGKINKEDSVVLNPVSIGYAGSVLPVETPFFIYGKINNLVSRLFRKNSFLILIIAKVNYK